jgi:hypothetical protein
MSVYLTFVRVPYEGSIVLGVYLSKADAVAAVDARYEADPHDNVSLAVEEWVPGSTSGVQVYQTYPRSYPWQA